MDWISCVGCEKLQRDFVAQTFALIAPVQFVLQQVPCSYETSPNAPKYQETDQNFSLGSNVPGWVCLLRKKSRRHFVPRTFALIALVHPVLHRVSCSYDMLTNAPKQYETHQNMSLGSNGLDQVLWLRKITTRLHGTNFCINCTSSVCFALSVVTQPNYPKCTQIV